MWVNDGNGVNYYEFISGLRMKVNPIDVPEESKCFKVLLPVSEEDFNEGGGESVWACADEDAYQKYKEDAESGIYFVRILNNSLYYPDLNCDSLIPVQLRGQNKPVALLRELNKLYGTAKRDQAIQMLFDYQKNNK
jgi:hypothetical protein